MLCSYQKEHPGTKWNNFSGSLIQVDNKTHPNFENQWKNDPLAFNWILCVFHKPGIMGISGKHIKSNWMPGGNFLPDYKTLGVF